MESRPQAFPLKPRILAGAGAVYLLFGPEAAIFFTDITTEEQGSRITAEVDVSPENSAVFALTEIFVVEKRRHKRY